MSTKIEWAEDVWNPIAGCNDVSEGCRNCYARTMARRLAAMGQKKYAGLTVLQGSKTVWTGKIFFDGPAMFKPIQRKKPTRYFVNSRRDPAGENRDIQIHCRRYPRASPWSRQSLVYSVEDIHAGYRVECFSRPANRTVHLR